MKLVTFQHDGRERSGLLLGEGSVLDLAAADPSLPSSLQAFIEAGEPALEAARRLNSDPPPEAVRQPGRLLAPLPRPVRLRDCSLFIEHLEVAFAKMEQDVASRAADPVKALEDSRASGRFALKPEFRRQVIYYNADHMHVYGPGDDVPFPVASSWLDYELEWACVIGKTGTDIAKEDARDHILGYTIFNDWSARDLQIPFMDCGLGPGEGKDFANSLGPCIVTADELGDPYHLTMTARVNGEEWSRGSTSSMHHRFEDAVVQFSRSRTLAAGEIIGSGTVLSGCGYELGRRLQPGDTVELEVEGIGVLANRVVTYSSQSGET